MCIPKLLLHSQTLWLNDTVVDEHKHMRGENMLEPRKPRDYEDQFCTYVVGLLIP